MKLKVSEQDIVLQLEDFVGKLCLEDIFSGSILVARHGEVHFKNAYGLASKGYSIKNKGSNY